MGSGATHSDRCPSLIAENHLQQMRLWGIRQGIEFYPKQDTPDRSRSSFIQKQFEINKLDVFLPVCLDLMLKSGSLLWYFAPTGDGSYAVSWYPKHSYKAYYDTNGLSLIKVVFKTYYIDEDISRQVFGQDMRRWLRVTITAQQIKIEAFLNEPTIEPYEMMSGYGFSNPQGVQVYPNVLGFIPCTESLNKPREKGGGGVPEFDFILDELNQEAQIRGAMRQNINMFGSPTLVTSKTAGAVLKAQDDYTQVTRPGYLQHGWAAANGYQNSLTSSTARSLMKGVLAGSQYGVPAGGSVGGVAGRGDRIAPIIGGIKQDERFAYLQVDPISTDQWQFVGDYAERLHETLGGIDPLGSVRTFGELKSLSGKVAATSRTKAEALWGHGLAALFELMIKSEETLFTLSYGQQLLEKGFIKDPTQITADLIQSAYYDNGIILPAVGLCPYGLTTVKWRHKGPVFEDSPQDTLQYSIVTRNLQELGVGSIEALKYLFPSKTNKEIEALLTGIPFRYITQTVTAMQQLLQLQQTMYQMPDPQNPNAPLGLRLSVDRILEYALSNLEREISYGQKYEQSSPSPSASGSVQPSAIPDAPGFVSPSGTSPAGTNSSSTAIPSSGRLDIPGTFPSPGSVVSSSSGIGLQPNNTGISIPRATAAPRAAAGLPVARPDDYPIGIPSSVIPTDLALHPSILAGLYPELLSQRPETPSKTPRDSRRSRRR